MNLRLEMGERGEREKGEGRGNLHNVRPQALGRGVGPEFYLRGFWQCRARDPASTSDPPRTRRISPGGGPQGPSMGQSGLP